VNERPEIANKVKKYIGIKEFIFHKFFKKYVVDHSLASAMGMMNLQTLDWDEEALNIAGVTRAHLSELVPTTKVFSNCDPDLARQIGIDSTTSFVIGASDGVLSNLGVNAIKKSQSVQAVQFGPLLISRKQMKKSEYFAIALQKITG
jgi:gluconokinase